MKKETCRFCGREFDSERGRKYCSDECKAEATKRFWAENNRNRKTGAVNILYTKTCPICQKEFKGRSIQKYCSKKCAAQAKRKHSQEYFPGWYQENKDSVIESVKERRAEKRVGKAKSFPTPQSL